MLNARISAWVKGYTTLPFIDHEWKAKYVTYPRSAQALHWMPGLQPGLTRKDTQHFPILAMTENLSMLYIPEALRHYIECQDFSLDYQEKITKDNNISLYNHAGTSVWVNQKRYTTFPYISHDWKTKYVIYPRSTQAWHWMPGLQSGWTRKDTQHFPILNMTEKLSMLYIPEALRHYTECQDFSLD